MPQWPNRLTFFWWFLFFSFYFFFHSFYGVFSLQGSTPIDLYCERPVSRVLNVLRVPASATIDGSWFQSLTDANIVHDQSGDAVKLARGLTRAMLWLRDLCMCLMFTASWGMAISPWSILWSMVSLCSFLRDASSFQPSSLRMLDTLTIPCTPFAHLAPCLWT